MDAFDATRRDADELLACDHVCGVMTGTKIVQGTDTGVPCVSVIVRRKGDTQHPIPKEIHGVPTDVIEDDPQWLSAEWPCMCGDDIGVATSGHHGTLGLVYYIAPTLYGMTCGHVVHGYVGTGITHPGGIGQWYRNDDGVMCNRAQIGVLAALARPESGVDAAAIALEPGGDPPMGNGWWLRWSVVQPLMNHIQHHEYDTPLLGKAPITGYPVYSERICNKIRHHPESRWTWGLATAQRGDAVSFCGARSLYQIGDVFATNCIVQTRYGTTPVIMRDMVVVRTTAQAGDSGALVMNAANRGIAMVTMASRWAYCQPINTCLQALHGPLSDYQLGGC